MLAYEDPAVKAYFETRSRYLGGVPADHLFWYAGESLACVWIDGQLAATWRWSRPNLSVEWCAMRDLTRHQAMAVADEVSAAEAWLRGDWDDR
jgi:hypothetical protein